MSSQFPQPNYIACLLGGAIGDALGAPIEFMNISDIKYRYGSSGIVDYVEYPDGTGEFTDDTQMTIFTAEGLIRSWNRARERGIIGAMHIIVHDSYLRWLHTQSESLFLGKYNRAMSIKPSENGWLLRQKELFKRRAPGTTCLTALQSGQVGTIEEPLNKSKGCGGIMRVAPVGLVFPGQNEFSFKTASEFAAFTHGHPSGYLSAGFFASVISDLAVGINLEESINNALAILKNLKACSETLHAVESVLNLFAEKRSLMSQEPNKIPGFIEQLGAGWVGEEALAISLFCSLLYQNDFEKGVLAAVNHSGDSDSTGSITGNILGLINGINSIPEKWIKNLRYNNIVSTIGEDLHTVVKGNSNEIDPEFWDKYPGT